MVNKRIINKKLEDKSGKSLLRYFGALKDLDIDWDDRKKKNEGI